MGIVNTKEELKKNELLKALDLIKAEVLQYHKATICYQFMDTEKAIKERLGE